MSYNFNITIKTANFEIQVDTAATYGYFEHNELGDECGGGLWFERHGDKLSLTDYDGVACLPLEVSDALIEAGFVVNEEFR